jgi:hypothetical protein
MASRTRCSTPLADRHHHSDRRCDGCGEGQAEIGPGPAAPASPMRFSGEGAIQPGEVSAHERGCPGRPISGPKRGAVDRGNSPPPKPQRPPSGPESCLGGDTVTADYDQAMSAMAAASAESGHAGPMSARHQLRGSDHSRARPAFRRPSRRGILSGHEHTTMISGRAANDPRQHASNGVRPHGPLHAPSPDYSAHAGGCGLRY